MLLILFLLVNLYVKLVFSSCALVKTILFFKTVIMSLMVLNNSLLRFISLNRQRVQGVYHTPVHLISVFICSPGLITNILLCCCIEINTC